MKWKGNVKITVRDLEGNIVDVQTPHNLIPTVSLAKVRDFWEGLITDGEIISMGVGSDNTVPALTDVGLGHQYFRKQVTLPFSEPTAAGLTTTVYITLSEAIGQIEELGWFSNFAIDDFWLAENDDFIMQEINDHIIFDGDGVLFSRVLYSHPKTTLHSIQVERTDTIAEA